MNMDTHVPLDLSLCEVENRRAIKRPWISIFKVTRCHAIDVKKIWNVSCPPPRSYGQDMNGNETSLNT